MRPAQAGRYRHLVTLKAPPGENQAGDPGPQNDLGEPTSAPKTMGTRWARVTPLSGRELWAAQQVQADVTHEVELRYFPGLKPSWLITWHGRTLNVESVQNVEERNRVHVALCKEEV